MVETKKVMIDTDPGIDDSAAVLFALAPAGHKEAAKLDVKSITTVSGNLIASRCTSNLRRVLKMVDRTDIPIGQGPEKPLVRKYPRDPFFHGNDGLGDLNLPGMPSAVEDSETPAVAADLIIEMATKYEGDISFVALGPLTNLALAFIKDPTLHKKIKEVIIIGGSFGFDISGGYFATGDNPVSEWNVYVDPEAADIVFNGGFNVIALGQDLFTRPSIALHAKEYEQLSKSKSLPAKFITGILDFARGRGFNDYCALIDSLAIAYAMNSSVFKTEKLKVAVELKSDIALGQVIVDRRKNSFRWEHLPEINAVSDINGERYTEMLMMSYLSYKA